MTNKPIIPLDKERIKSAVAALIRNAIEAMENPPRLFKIVTSIRDEYIEIAVSDTGKRIPEGHIQYIFDPFFTSKIYGPGLGLKFAQRIIQAHKGTITVESEPGKGTTFIVRLPLNAL